MLKQLIYTGAFILCFTSCGTSGWTEGQRAEATDYCITSGNQEDFCECSVSILVTAVSYDEFIHWNNKVLSGEYPDQDILSKMIKMGQRVKAECAAK